MFKAYKITFKFNASHYMGSIENIHPHTFFVKIYLSPINDGLVLYENLEKEFNNYISKYGGKVVNDFEEFTDIIPTIENMGRVFFRVFENFCKGVKLLRLEISDGPLKTFCIGEKIIAGSVHNEISKEELNKLIEKVIST